MDDTNHDLHSQIRACELCGGAVTIHGTCGEGTRYYVPVAQEWLERVMAKHGSDEFIRDRLQRAERIIVDLRKKLAEKNGD